MENCLVTKLKSVVDNDNLRRLNEIRFVATAQGTGTNPVKLTYSNLGATGEVEYEVISGNAYFMNATSTVNYGTYVKSSNDIVLYVTSGQAEISIKNFNLVATKLGYGTNDNYLYPYKLYNDNAPICIFNTDEFTKNLHTQLTAIGTYMTGDVASLNNLVNLTSLKVNKADGVRVWGKLSDLSPIVGLNTLIFGNPNPTEGLGFEEFEWSFNDLASSNIENIAVNSTHCLGGDLYPLLSSKANLNLVATRTDPQGRPQITCSYTSGQTIPTISIGNINLYLTGKIDKTNVLNFMNLLKDGANASKISVSGQIMVSSTAASDSDVVALKTELAGLGITFTLYS